MVNITFEKFKVIVTRLYKLNLSTEQYLKALGEIDPDLEDHFTESKPVNNLYLMNDILMIQCFGDLSDVVNWLFYDFQDGETNILHHENDVYYINNLDEYFNTIKEIYY